jgi:peptidoglycan/LPS O-acetylase OafA/YrhL
MSPTATGEGDPNRANNFDFLRFVLAVAVIFSHSYPLSLGSNDREPVMRLTGGQATGGELAVAGFFILSGYLITKSWVQSSSLWDYLRRRVLRIYPGFLAAVAFSAWVAGPFLADRPADYWHDFPLSRFVLEAFNLQGPVTPPVLGGKPGIAINGSLWSIRYEFLCYLGVVALGLAGAFRRPGLVLGAFLGWLALYAAQVELGVRIPGGRFARLFCEPDQWPRLASCFLSGALFYLYRDRIVYSRRRFAAAALGLVVLALLPGLKGLPLAVPVLGAFAFFSAGFLPTRRLRGFARRGDLSYGMYLYAYPTQQLLVRWLGPGVHPLGLFALAFAITAGLAALSWTFVERPFLRLKSSGLRRPAVRLVAAVKGEAS